MRGQGIALALGLAALAACGSAPENETAPVPNAATPAPGPQPQPAANATAPKPAGAPAPAQAGLAAYVDHYPFDEVEGVTFLQHPQVRAAVAAAVPDAAIREWMFERVGPTTPIVRRDGRLLSWGCEAHNCGPHAWTILIDEAGSAAEVCYHDEEADGEASRWFATGRPVETRNEECPSE